MLIGGFEFMNIYIEIEKILTKLQYFDLHFVSHDTFTNTYAYDGYLDTFYRIHVSLVDEQKMEIWDCVYDEENFVRAGIAHLVKGTWEIIEVKWTPLSRQLFYKFKVH